MNLVALLYSLVENEQRSQSGIAGVFRPCWRLLSRSANFLITIFSLLPLLVLLVPIDWFPFLLFGTREGLTLQSRN